MDHKSLTNKLKSAKFIVADSYFLSHYPELKEVVANKITFYVESPEASKVVDIYYSVCEFFIENRISRSDEILVIGGGATSDLGGFVASTILRGVSWSVIPTTLLAMVDAAIGGKVGINSKFGKNLIGNFHEPQSVHYYFPFLETLSQTEKNSGMGEVVKYAFLELPIFKAIENREELNSIILSCAQMKSEVVKADFKEGGARKILNLGHSFGHAFERSLEIPHGEAVLRGLKLIIEIYANQLLADFERVLKLLDIKLETKLCEFLLFEEHFLHDKKSVHSKYIDLIIPKEIGRVEIDRKQMSDVLDDLRNHANYNSYFK